MSLQPPNEPCPTVGLDEAAHMLGLTPSDLKDQAARMTRDHGFPARLPALRWRWSRARLLAWIDHADCQPPTTPAGGALDPQGIVLPFPGNAGLRAAYLEAGR